MAAEAITRMADLLKRSLGRWNMGVLDFLKKDDPKAISPETRDLVEGFSVEVMPRTAQKIEDFRELLPADTRVYIAHIEGTPIAEMVATARRLREEGFAVMPHFPARVMKDRTEFEGWVARYAGEAGVDQALVLAGGPTKPLGALESSIELLETGAFDRHGFKRLHVAGHPEGNRDIDRDGTDTVVSRALSWKQAFSDRTDAEMAIVTQFVFEADPVIDWIRRIRRAGVTLPVHVGVAGPAKLQTLIKFAASCGVGPSLGVLQKRAKDVTRLVLPFEPTDIVRDLAAYRARDPENAPAQIHMFPLGGIRPAAEWATAQLGTDARAAG